MRRSFQAARRLIECEGRDGFSNDVPASVGIRAPSLYGRFKDRDNLLGAVELQVCAEIAALLGKLIIANDPEATLMAQWRAVYGPSDIRKAAIQIMNCGRSPPILG
jgi:AcrR family transcriptional regulator